MVDDRGDQGLLVAGIEHPDIAVAAEAGIGGPGLEGPQGEYLTDRLTDEADRFIESSEGRPFFLYLAHFAVHDPIQGRADLVKRYEKKLEKMPEPQGAAFILEGNPDSQLEIQGTVTEIQK